MKIEAFSGADADYEAIIAIESVHDPDTTATVEAWRHSDENPDLRTQRLVGNHEGRIVAVGYLGEVAWIADPGYLVIGAKALPEFHHRAELAAMMEALTERAVAWQGRRLLAKSTSADPEWTETLEEQGFEMDLRQRPSRLDLETYDGKQFEALVSRLETEGIRFVDLPEAMKLHTDCVVRLANLKYRLMQDVPSTITHPKPVFPQWERDEFGIPDHWPEGYLIAIDGDDYVGLTRMMTAGGDKSRLKTDLTGVLRTHRRRGIALALKHLAINRAREAGGQMVTTTNEENNPMYLINDKLGFEELPMELYFEKPLET